MSELVGSGLSPQNQEIENLCGVWTKENLVNSVLFCFSSEKPTKCSQNSGLVNQVSAASKNCPTNGKRTAEMVKGWVSSSPTVQSPEAEKALQY